MGSVKRDIKKNKIIVMIPAYNEELTIASVIKSIPRTINNHKVEVLVINDGSSDNTVLEAEKSGADYIINNTINYGLAYSFQKGMNKSLELGADIIVNTDADNQYNQKEIDKLTIHIIQGKADIVSGNRQIETLNHIPKSKKYGNIIGTKVVKIGAGYHIEDASSGFRAYSREAALKLFVTATHTYTHDTLIQAKYKNLKVLEVPVEFKKRENGDSKLIKSVYSHVKKSSSTIVRTTLMYNSLKFFSYFGLLLTIIGFIPMFRWIYLSYIIKDGGQHIQSLLLGVLLIMAGGMSILLGWIADLLAINRKYLEDIQYRVRRLELNEK